jgi:hypothetical protein
VLRTVTFSDARVAAFVNANFVPAWHDRGPGFFDATLSTERWIFESAAESYPTRNICTFFLSPEGRVFHYAAGHHGPDLFLRILESAVALRKTIFDERMSARAGVSGAVQAFHEDQVFRYSLAAGKMRSAADLGAKGNWQALLRDYRMPSYRGRGHAHSASCARSLSEGLEYLSHVHRRWAGIGELPDLEDVRYDYLWGNSFTEEGGKSRQIAGSNGEAERREAEREAAKAWTSFDMVPRRPWPETFRDALGLPDLLAPSGAAGKR